MDCTCTYQVSAILLIKGIEIWFVLEVVCIQIAGLQCVVRLYIISILYDLQIVALVCQKFSCSFQDLGVRCRACAYYQLLQIAVCLFCLCGGPSAVSAAVSAVVSFELEEQPAKDAAASSARNVVPKNDFFIVISSSLCV